MIICPEDICTGCCGCMNACSVNAITMRENQYGEYVPIIDENICINCGKCVKICPNNTKVEQNKPIKTYAAWVDDSKKSPLCASGGIASLFSEFVINNGGVVYGTAFDDNLVPKCTRIDNLDGLELLKGSKYVQSYVGSTYADVKKDLNNGVLVLFISTPCQVAGLLNFLHKHYDHLITVDLVCHGVPPTKYFLEEISFLQKDNKLDRITNCRFRGKGSDFRFTLWEKEKNLYDVDCYCQPYYYGFLKGLTLRSACSMCTYANPNRVADITLGDFIGLGDKSPFNHTVDYVSLVLLNNSKSVALWKKVSSNNMVNFEERDFDEAYNGGISLRRPIERHKKRDKFQDAYTQYGFSAAIRKVMKNKFHRPKKPFIVRAWRRFVRLFSIK